VDLAGTLSQKLEYQEHGTNLDGKSHLLWIKIRGNRFLNQSKGFVAVDKSQEVGRNEGWGTWGSLGNKILTAFQCKRFRNGGKSSASICVIDYNRPRPISIASIETSLPVNA